MKVNGEVIVERTIRLLKENGVNDIYISSNDKRFEGLGVPVLKHKNSFVHKTDSGSWLDAYYLMDEPCCYLHGDVYFSGNAIKEIVNAPVKDVLFICTFDGSDKKFKRNEFNIKGREPFGFKVVNQKKFQKAIKDIQSVESEFALKPIAWHIYRYVNGLPLKKNAIKYTEVNNIFDTDGEKLIINDYTRDIDELHEIKELEETLKRMGNV